MINGQLLVEKLLVYAELKLHLNKRDEIYFRNLLLREFKLLSPTDEKVDEKEIESLEVPDNLVNEVENYAVENNIILEESKGLYSAYIFGLLSPLPSKVNEDFSSINNTQGIEKACEYFYDLCVKNNYIQKTAISRNLFWKYDDKDKYLEITINLSKPEKNNKDIAKLLKAPQNTFYPKCALCKENEGFEGNLKQPPRENIRTISINLDGEKWFVQYSPYAYFNEHLIAINEKHTPMQVSSSTIRKLLDFVDIFPNYMIGSNASLPIVGGSILNHEHYQGGEHLMPMQHAKIKRALKNDKFVDVNVGIVDWYNSVIRLESENRNNLSILASEIIDAWANYTNKDISIFAETNGEKHNTLAPICRKSGNKYILDMILRNNITTSDYPDGLYHAHPEYHNIKKEGIGLIESMGLFILPGRLKRQLHDIAEILCKNIPYDEKELEKQENDLYIHRNMIKELVSFGYQKDFTKAEEKVKEKVNEVCKNILFNTAVFKNDKQGEEEFIKFLSSINIK